MSEEIYYEDGSADVLVGPPRKRKGQARRLSTHVPVRFAADIIERVRNLSDEDGLTVSSWIRRVVEREVERRQPRAQTQALPGLEWILTNKAAVVQTANEAQPTKHLSEVG